MEIHTQFCYNKRCFNTHKKWIIFTRYGKNQLLNVPKFQRIWCFIQIQWVICKLGQILVISPHLAVEESSELYTSIHYSSHYQKITQCACNNSNEVIWTQLYFLTHVGKLNFVFHYFDFRDTLSSFLINFHLLFPIFSIKFLNLPHLSLLPHQDKNL